MKCMHCQGAMRRSMAPFNIDRNGYRVAFDAVPAWVCGQCGEPHFEEREVDAIQRLIRDLDERTRQLVTDVAPPRSQGGRSRALEGT